MSDVSLKNVSFKFSSKNKTSFNIENFSLEIEDGTFTTLLGPSGCGKTTLLRLIAGFLKPDSGEISIDNKIINEKEPYEREIAFVFQDYALFPHLTVEKNLLYGLNNLKEKISKQDSQALVHQVARLLALEGLLDRYPHQISGGQQQRVALGRSLVLKPKILLMDEPLSSLDAKLRIQVREELREIQQNLGITTIYVTHDREEAFSLSDKIAVINHGKLQQYGTPKEIYFSPENRFTADFAGRANFIEEGGQLLLVRPEWIKVSEENSEVSGKKIRTGTVLFSEFLGQITRFHIKCDFVQGGILIVDTMGDLTLKNNKKVNISIEKTVKISIVGV